MTHARHHHMALTCRDPETVERFYTRHLGYQRARVVQLGDTQIVFLRAGESYLELFKADEDAPVEPAGADGPHYPGWRHLAFKVDDVDAKLAEMGADAVVTLGPLDFNDYIAGWRSVWVSDPEGNIVEISQGFVDQDDVPELQA